MKKKVLYILVIISSIIYTLNWVSFHENQDGGLGLSILLKDLFFFLLISTLLGALASLIPIRKLKFLIKLSWFIPITLFLILTTLSLVIYLDDPKDYLSIEIPDNLDCSDLKEGEFLCQGLLIRRGDSIQTQMDLSTKKINEYKIRWITDCEYELIGVNSNVNNRKAKIFEITEKGHKVYTCLINNNEARIVEIMNKK